MQSSSVSRWIIGAVVCAGAVWVSGCSALRFAYNQGDEIAYWWLDAYVDFNREQKPRVRSAIQQWFQWNRTSQLAGYSTLLNRLEGQARGDVTAQEVCRDYEDILEKIEGAAAHAVPAAAELARSLDAEQLDNIARKYEATNKEFADDYLQDTPDDRLKAAMKRSLENAEKVYGKLDDGQREWLQKGLAQSPFDPQLWLAERKARQQDVMAVLRRINTERLAPEPSQAAIRGAVQRMVRSPRESYRTYQRKLIQYNCELTAQLHNRTTPGQRDTAVERLRGWNEDLRRLGLPE